MKKNNDNTKRSSLTIGALIIMGIALIVITLSFSYVFGSHILSRLIPSIPEPHPITLNLEHFILYLFILDIVMPIFFFFGILFVIFLSLRHVISQKRSYGVRPEFALIANSLIMTAFGVHFLGGEILYKPNLSDLLYNISLILVLLGLGSVAIGFTYKYFIEKK
jgi:hypothetical protein